jgi:hypothetical protein
MATATEKQKKEQEKANKEAAKNQEPITADPMDGTPPGSASPNERGTPSRNVTEATTSKTAAPATAATVPIEPDQVIATVPYKEVNPVDVVRQSLLQKMNQGLQEEKRSKKKDIISNRALHRLIATFDSDPTLAGDLDAILDELGITEEQLEEAKMQAIKNPAAFAAQIHKDNRLHSLGLPPDAAPRRGDDKPSGLHDVIDDDKKYWPTRYSVPVDEDNFENGDLIYQVHEDSTFVVLSAEQQTRSWQRANTLPAMNLISRVGYDDVAEIVMEEA